jgi:hypothetical protein
MTATQLRARLRGKPRGYLGHNRHLEQYQQLMQADLLEFTFEDARKIYPDHAPTSVRGIIADFLQRGWIVKTRTLPGKERRRSIQLYACVENLQLLCKQEPT